MRRRSAVLAELCPVLLAEAAIGDQMGWYADWKLASNGRGNAFLSGPDASALTQTQEEALQTVRDKLAGADLPEEERTRPPRPS
ncbi:MAG: hypothetical protein R3C04_00495 [Hyphomonas sp.]